MGAFYIGYQTDAVLASTMAFATLALARLFHGFNCRGEESIFRLKLTTNKYSLYAFFAGFALLCLVLFVPGLNTLFEVSGAFTLTHFGYVVLLAIAPTVVIQLVKVFRDIRRNK